MGGWVGGWVGEWVGGWMDGWMDGWDVETGLRIAYSNQQIYIFFPLEKYKQLKNILLGGRTLVRF